MTSDTGSKAGSTFQDAIPSTSALHSDLSEDIDYAPVPYAPTDPQAQKAPIWRIRLALVTDTVQQFGLEINGEIILGRDADIPNLVNLKNYTQDTHGISRQHLMLRPTVTNLYAIDVGSTNGTFRNGRSIGVNNPTPLHTGDIIDLGGLQLILHIVERPALQTATLQEKLDQADALTQIAKAITSQLDPDEVLNQVVETAHFLTSAGETAIWLVDEQTGELFLEAEKGIEDEKVRRMRIPIREDNPAGKVIHTGKPLRAVRQPGEDQIKVKTGYLVESLLYVPVNLGGVTLGVIAAGHREGGKSFSRRDERLLTAIADFTAIAIQNARVYQATDQALERRVKELAALNEVAHAVSSSLDLAQVYNVLVTQLNRHWPVEAVHLYLFNERQGGLIPLRLGKFPPQAKIIKHGLVSQAAKTKTVIMSHDVADHPAYIPEVDDYDGQTPETIACIPLTIQNKVVGVLSLINKANGHFEEEDMALLRAFANPVATAIENARLFAESKRQQAAIQATAQTITEPLLILDEHGQPLVANKSARKLLEDSMSQLFEGISRSVGRTAETTIGEQTYLTTAQHLPEVGTIVVMQDITYVKRLEKDRAEFMRALSHDLKSPLTSIKGFAQLMDKVMTLNEKGQRFVRQIVEATDRMLDMINQMLQLTRDEVIEPERSPCQLDKIVAKVFRDLEGAALHKETAIRYKIFGTPYVILADETRLYHMILNLVDNAIKYSPPCSTVSAFIEFKEEVTVVRVQDEGPGIPEKELPRVFDKYYRGEHGKKQSGTGVGLSVVWAIADAHGGQATVRNLPQKGAEFTINLPVSLRLGAENLNSKES
ncbi:MAG: GAF domain-containing protein [Ardenticatenaceae bacterium]|nr:GAF domain-containing protein [Ardenticatenaceae bacterium]